jgi:hypothetical protein
MFNIAQYLERFKNFGQGERLLKEAVRSAVFEAAGFDIEIKNITVKNGEIIFRVSPALKNSLFIKKNLILTKLQDKTNQVISDLR